LIYRLAKKCIGKNILTASYCQEKTWGKNVGTFEGLEVKDYTHFYQHFSKKEEKPVLASLVKMIPSEEGRRQLGRYLIKGICNLYQGNYDPHYLTDLGSALWVVNHFWNQPSIAINALAQYVNYFFARMTY